MSLNDEQISQLNLDSTQPLDSQQKSSLMTHADSSVSQSSTTTTATMPFKSQSTTATNGIEKSKNALEVYNYFFFFLIEQ